MPQTLPENLHETPDMTAAEIMRPVPAVTPTTSVAEVLRLMVDYDVAGVAVIDADEIVGIITESDVVERQADVEVPLSVPFLDAIFVIDAGRPYEEEIRKALAINASQLMSAPVISVRSAANLEQIATIMSERDVHPLPVVGEDGRYMGIVSRRDLVHVIAELETRIS